MTEKKQKMRIDKVLIVQPTSTLKLCVKWDGPWVVTRKLNEVNYEIDMGRHKTVLQISLFKNWEERSKLINLVIIDEGIQDEKNQCGRN
jgi:hypothetical protein